MFTWCPGSWPPRCRSWRSPTAGCCRSSPPLQCRRPHSGWSVIVALYYHHTIIWHLGSHVFEENFCSSKGFLRLCSHLRSRKDGSMRCWVPWMSGFQQRRHLFLLTQEHPQTEQNQSKTGRQSIISTWFIRYFRTSLSTWQPFACASCESCLLSAGSTLHQMKHCADVSKTFYRNTLSLTVLQSISRLPLIALSSTSWNGLHLSLNTYTTYKLYVKKSCAKSRGTLYTVSTIALFGNIVTTLSEPAATLWRKDRYTG